VKGATSAVSEARDDLFDYTGLQQNISPADLEIWQLLILFVCWCCCRCRLVIMKRKTIAQYRHWDYQLDFLYTQFDNSYWCWCEN